MNINNLKTYIFNTYTAQISLLQANSVPLKKYWQKQTIRDKQILLGVGAAIIVTVLFLIISGANSYKTSLEHNNLQLTNTLADTQDIAQQYQLISQITPNNFSDVTQDKITADVKQLLDIKDADIILSNNILTISGNNVKFSALILLVEQLRHTYALFPNQLKVTRLSRSGYVTFNAIFNNVSPQ